MRRPPGFSAASRQDARLIVPHSQVPAMRELLVSIQDVDFSRLASLVGELIKNADMWLLGVVVVFLVCLGHKIAIGHRVVYGWGLRLAALEALGFGGYTLWAVGGGHQGM